ncbi:unnamed protein product [Lactuca saligna]|uniref:Uncharacterized protein n=1 Tax=Lactuca saligna TaxID=75948 RepID=A0AA35VHH1_LACSI|nr:unnamed protein product [Lactuca saligna]
MGCYGATLSDLFVVDDTKKIRGGVARIESRNLGFSSFAESVLDTKEDKEDDEEEEHNDDDDEIRVSDVVFVQNEVDDDGIKEGDLKTAKKKKNKSSSFRYQSCFTDETHDGRWQQQQAAAVVLELHSSSDSGQDGSFAASTSCSDELDEDGGERSWVRRREEVVVTTIFVGGGKSSSGRGLLRQPSVASSLFKVTGGGY